MSETCVSFFGKATPFPPIPDDGRINAEEFLNAAAAIVPMFEKMSGFGPVISDVNGNIKKVRTKKDSNPGKYVTINDILKDELDELSSSKKSKPSDDSAIVGSLWLTRGLRFILEFLKNMLDGADKEKKGAAREESLKSCINKAYDDTLAEYHNFIVKRIFKGVASFAPKKQDLLEQLKLKNTENPEKITEDMVIEEMRAYIPLLEDNVNLMTKILVQHKIEEEKALQKIKEQ